MRGWLPSIKLLQVCANIEPMECLGALVLVLVLVSVLPQLPRPSPCLIDRRLYSAAGGSLTLQLCCHWSCIFVCDCV